MGVKSIGKREIPSLRQPNSIWFVYLPPDEDRDQYIQSSLRTSTVTLINMNGEIQHRVPVGKSAINYIEFPDNESQFGSPVMCANERMHNQLFVVEVFEQGDTFNIKQENQKRFSEQSDNGLSEVIIDGQGSISLNASNDIQDNGGKVYVNIASPNESGELKIDVNGTINIINTGNTNIETSDGFQIAIYDGNEQDIQTTIKYTNDEGFSYIDQFDNQISIIDGEINIKSSKISINDGTEPIILGNQLVNLLNDLIAEIAASLVTTAIGQSPLINSAQILAFQNQLEQLKSLVSFTD